MYVRTTQTLYAPSGSRPQGHKNKSKHSEWHKYPQHELSLYVGVCIWSLLNMAHFYTSNPETKI